MYRQLRYLKPDEDNMNLIIPDELKGKLVEISIAEKSYDYEAAYDEDAKDEIVTDKIELQMLDKIRNQLYVWDI